MTGFEKLLKLNSFNKDDESQRLFRESLKECLEHHQSSNPYINFLFKKYDFNIASINTEEDLKKVPFVMVNLFKEHNFKSVEDDEIILTLGSSGTSGQRSQMHLDQRSLENVKMQAYNIHRDLGIVDDQVYNYLCFTYDPQVAGDIGTAFTDELLTGFTKKNDVYYALTFNDKINDFEFDLEKTKNKLIEFSKGQYPVRILGFPAFLMKVVNDLDRPLTLPRNSWVQTGGGWKTSEKDKISKDEFRSLISEKLNIKKQNIRDMFGMVEHGVPYLDCENGKLRIPNFSRIFIRDPKTLKVLPEGSLGLIQFICSYNFSYPSFSILTTDWGKVATDQRGQYLVIEGRAGITKNKGCAIKAGELLNV